MRQNFNVILIFLFIVGHNCPNIRELDIAGAEIVTDFGVVCLLLEDAEQIFVEAWNREKTVGGSGRRSSKSFPQVLKLCMQQKLQDISSFFFFLQPYFDKPIPDPTEAPTPGSNKGNSQGGYLYLKKAFYDVISNSAYPWQTLDICKSLQKLRLENTKVKGDGASVVLYCCPNVYSLGYLVFAAAGLKQVIFILSF